MDRAMGADEASLRGQAVRLEGRSTVCSTLLTRPVSYRERGAVLSSSSAEMRVVETRKEDGLGRFREQDGRFL